MVNIENYIGQLTDLLKDQFGTRLLYVGLQGSYLRGEATPSSDIDVMIIIDDLHVADLDSYRSVLQSMEHFEKSCGFICGKADLANWNPLEICHLINTTKDYYGVLRNYTPDFTEQDIRNFIKLSTNNLYHEICHRYIHAENNNSVTELSATYKGVFFILQNLYYLKCGKYIATKAELLPLLEDMDYSVLKHSIEFSNGMAHSFAESFELLFVWCQETMHSI